MAVPIARITDAAQQVRVGAALLTLLLAPFYVLGWLAGKGVLALAFLAAAVKIGWNDSRKARSGPAR